MKRLFVPLTLERVGSEGKFFTDNTILKMLGTLVTGVVVGTLFYSYTAYFLVNWLSLTLSIAIPLVICYYLTRFWVLRERELFKLLQKLSQHKIVNVGEFSDIYDCSKGICLHTSGHMSCFVRVVRGSTLGMTEKEKEMYYRSIKLFEDSILASGYSFKVFNFETPVIKDPIFMDQRNSCRKQNYKSLEQNLTLKNNYTKVFMENCIRDENFVYCIITEIGDTEHFRLKVEQAEKSLINQHIREFKILDEEEINEFAKEYSDVQYFEFENDSDDEFEDILKIEE